MLPIIQHIKHFLLLISILASLSFNAQEGLNNNQFNRDSISKYLLEEDTIKQILISSDKFLFNIENPDQTTLVSDIPCFLLDFRLKRLKSLSKLRNKIFEDSLVYSNGDTAGLLVLKYLYNTNDILIFKYEAYNDKTEIYDWFNESGFKIVSIEIHGPNYEESIFIDNKRIKKIVICEGTGYIQYYDLVGRVILSLDYVKGKIDRGIYTDHENKDFITILW